MRRSAISSQTLALAASIGGVLAVAALAGRIGADARWLAALGRLIASQHSIPGGIPFAPRASAHWPNVPVLAELIFNWLERLLGDRGLLAAQLVAVALALGALSRDSLSGGAEGAGTSRALLLACLGSLTAILVVRAQLFSVVLFPALCWLLRAEVRRPSWRIWLAVPLLALWSNLHGAALLGLAVLEGYLLVARLRNQPVTSVAVGAAAAAALCATPALADTPAYYHGVLASPLALSGQGMWAPLSLSSPLDVLFVLCALALTVQFARASPSLWEKIAAVGLAVLSVQAARNGVWLMLFLAPPAARGFAPRRQWAALWVPAAALSAGVLIFSLVRGPVPSGAAAALVARAVSIAHGSPVLAASVVEEQIAWAGGTIAVGDPIDAFSGAEQRAYLAWLDGARGSLRTLQPGVRVVLVMRGTPAARLMARQRRFLVAGRDRQTVLYTLAAGSS
jgi:hypothetical protein